MRSKRLVATSVVALAVLGGCAADETPPSATQTAPQETPYSVDIKPADFTTEIDNPWFPLIPGMRWVYEAETDEGKERIVVEVTDQTKETAIGVETVVVRDTVSLEGVVIEDTYDWFAQDKDGNVWYFGEDTKSFENGKLKDNKGSWESGKDGALPGIYMKADPKVDGEVYQQEYYEGEAIDTGEVIAVDRKAEVPFGTYEDTVVTEDINPLEPDVVENKYYASGVGLVLELHVKGGDERVELIEFKDAK